MVRTTLNSLGFLVSGVAHATVITLDLVNEGTDVLKDTDIGKVIDTHRNPLKVENTVAVKTAVKSKIKEVNAKLGLSDEEERS
jgi:hypothetical protein